jgi:NADPH:quinone reductase-like Zn-dependent oxidoreductase
MGFGVDAWLQTLSENEQKGMQTYLIENLQQPGFQLPVSEKFPFTQFMEAIQAYESGNQKGKILLEMN